MPLLAVALLGVVVACNEEVVGRPPVDDVDADVDAGAIDAATVDARAPFDPASPPIACAVTPCIVRLVGGPTHYCAVANDGIVRCWGNPSALGETANANGGGDPGATPVTLDAMRDPVDIGASALRTCFVHGDGTVDCIGKNEPKPVRVESVHDAKKLAIGDDRSCAIEATGKLACWGDSAATGQGETALTFASGGATDASMSRSAAFAVDASGTLYSWGSERAMLGREISLPFDWTPTPVDGLTPVLSVAAAERHVCALTTAGRLFCWGHGDTGALGLGHFRTVSMPEEVMFPGPAWPAQVGVAITHSCARMTDGSVTCWARVNASGELARASTEGVFVPTDVALPAPAAAIAVGTGSTCALLVDGSVVCWGSNTHGQLALGRRDGDRHFTPTPVVFP